MMDILLYSDLLYYLDRPYMTERAVDMPPNLCPHILDITSWDHLMTILGLKYFHTLHPMLQREHNQEQ